MKLSDVLSKSLSIATIALGAVSVAEATASSESTGASKKQVALDIVTNEAGLASVVDPADSTLINAFLGIVVDGAVAFYNLKGAFTHSGSGSSSATNTSTPAATVAAAS